MAIGALNDFALGKVLGAPKSPQEAASRLTGGAIPVIGPLKKTSGGTRKRGIDRLTSRYQPGQEMAEGSLQANYEERRLRIDPATGQPIPLSGEEVLQAKRFASENGMTFNANLGYRPATTQGQADSQGNRREQNLASKPDFNEVKTSKFVPADVRAIQAKGGPSNEKEAKRMARFQSSTAGQKIASGGRRSENRAGSRTPHRSGTGKTAPMQSQDQLTDSRGQMSEKRVKELYRPMSKTEAGKYSANLGKAWGNALDEAEKSSPDDATRQAAKAGMSVEERNRLVAESADRLNKYRAKIGAPVQAVANDAPSRMGQDGKPEYEFVDGNADGSVSRYRGQAAKVAESKGKKVTNKALAKDAPKTAKKKEEVLV